MNIKELRSNTRKLRKLEPISGKTLKKTSIAYKAKKVLVSYEAMGSGDSYEVNILFLEANVVKRGGVLIKDAKDVKHRVHIDKKSEIKVSCSCKDFEFTWGPYLKKSKALFGKLPEYKKKSGSGSGSRKSSNPDKHAGCCKHVLGLAELLKSKKFLK